MSSDQNIQTPMCTNLELSNPQAKSLFRTFGGYVVECKVGRSAKGKYARITLENNYKMYKAVVWSEEFNKFEKLLNDCERSFMLFSADLKYEPKWTKGNQFTFSDKSTLIILK